MHHRLALRGLTLALFLAVGLTACDQNNPTTLQNEIAANDGIRELVQDLHADVTPDRVAERYLASQQAIRALPSDPRKGDVGEDAKSVAYAMLGTTEDVHSAKLQRLYLALDANFPQLRDLDQAARTELIRNVLTADLRLVELRIRGERVEGESRQNGSGPQASLLGEGLIDGGVGTIDGGGGFTCDPARRDACVQNATNSYLAEVATIEAVYIAALFACGTTGPGVAACISAAVAVKAIALANATYQLTIDQDNCYLSYGFPGCENDNPVPGGGTGSGGWGGDTGGGWGDGGDTGGGWGDGGDTGSGGGGGTTCIDVHDALSGDYLGTCCGDDTTAIMQCASGL